MQLHQLKREHPLKRSHQIGRGGKRGKTAGRGTKGQLARSGRKLRPELRDLIKKLPKLRGHGRNRALGTNPSNIRPMVVKLGDIAKAFTGKASITPATLLEAGLIRRRGGVVPAVKVLAGGAYTSAFQFSGLTVSGSARAQIEKSGGTIA